MQIKPLNLKNIKEELLISPSAGGTKVALLYPNSYYFGMSNLGFHSLCRLITESSGLSLERFFQESVGKGKVTSLEDNGDLGRMSIILASISYEEDALNFLDLLGKAGIDPDRQNRNSPLIVAGGALVNIAPELFSRVADVLYTGYLGNRQKDVLRSVLLEYRIKEDLFKALSSEKGFFVPGLSRERTLNFPEDDSFEDSVCLSGSTEFSRMLLMEIGRGCPFDCRFCTVNGLYPKAYWRKSSHIKQAVEEAVKKGNGNLRRVGLIAPVPNFHPEIKYILSILIDLGMEVSLSSLRVGRADREFFSLLKKCGQRSFTIAPEVPGDQARRNMGKNVKNSEIFQCMDDAISSDFREVKMYFLLGCEGMCNEGDIAEMERFLERMPAHMKVRLSFNPVVAKPKSALQGEEMFDPILVKKMIKGLKKACSKYGNVSLTFGNLKRFALQYKIANGDENTLIDLHQESKDDKEQNVRY